ncbi:Uncharacterized protein FWK35_00008539 [Aphis craccivora]|uniref:Uncharacterized protein n=1 Tax=Aphis craccivora TaxID=307492 RepID=A0A6G0Z9S6_APHCR|nr:Uncharacterized protein FWK35_00008539 [Aphis craccivora]
MCISFLRPVLMYGCETWSVTKGDEEKLNIFERKVLPRTMTLRAIFGDRKVLQEIFSLED